MLFESYVGAVYASQGMSVVQNWIGQLVDPQFQPVSEDADMDPLNYPKKAKTERMKVINA